MYAREATSWQTESKVNAALQLQQTYLKDSTLMQYMTAMTITDEISIKALANEYEPRPHWSYKYLERKANDSIITAVRSTILPMLKGFSDKSLEVVKTMRPAKDSLTEELADGIEITALRAKHRYYTLQYILDRRNTKLHHLKKTKGESLLQQAAATRALAMAIVNRRQQHYRYPLELIATKRYDHTAYHFGYLWLASNLHLWHREEEEARRNKYSPWFMNVWNPWRIAGIIK
jgi:hypothetical protein